ncbi:MAG: PAS domain S-box protein [Nitrospirae bacterium]|nr:PAS domain S-box protein [Nitrospirota bacterium]
MTANKVLVVDDDPVTTGIISKYLNRRGYEITSMLTSAEEAIEDIRVNKPDAVVMDIALAGKMDGIEAAAYIYNTFHIPVVYMTSHTEQPLVERAKITEPYGYIVKPFTQKELEITIDMAIYKHKTDMLLQNTNENLREKEEFFRLITENIVEVFWITDPKVEKMYYISPGYERIWKRAMTSLYENPRSFLDAIHRDDVGRVIGELEILKTGQPFDNEYRIVHPDGTVRWIWGRGFPVRDKDGRVIQYIGAARDITARKEMQEKLRNSEAFLSNIIDNIPYMIFVKDATELRFVRVNKAGQKLLGYGEDELIGKTDHDIFSRNQADFFTEKDMEVIVSRQIVDIPEEPIKTKILGERILHTKKIPILNGGGNTQYLLGISEDITDRIRALKELIEAKEAAVTANRVKSDFLANMSHELRTPLNSIIGFSEVLEDELPGPLNEQQHENIRYILSAGRHLLNLINDILDLSKVESGKLETEFELLSLGELIDSSLIMHKERAMKNGLRLTVEMSPDMNIPLEVDERKIKQVLFNLISNAVKFTPKGGTVTVAARKIPDTNDVEVSVIDTGIGISSEDIPKLFTEFTQLESVYSKKYEGTGLGLALTKKLVELHKGSIWVESVPGAGSKFIFTLPVSQST